MNGGGAATRLTVLELHPAETVGDAVRRMRGAAGTIVLIVPKGARWSEADFEWLARRTAEADKRLAVVSGDGAVRAAAQAAGLPVYRRAPAALGGGWRHAVVGWPRRAVQRGEDLRRRPPLPRPALRRPARPNLALRLLVLLLTVAAGAGLGLLALSALPTGLVLVRPAQQAIDSVLTVTVVSGAVADATMGVAQGRGLEATAEARTEVSASDERQLAAERAAGSVQLLNRRSEAVTVPVGAVVETTSGTRVRFRILEKVTLPGEVGATARAPVMALEEGEAGNVPPYAINAIEPAWASSVAVVNERATEGGATRVSPQVTDEDRAEARAALEERLTDEAMATLRAQLAPSEMLAPDTIRSAIVSERFDLEPARRATGTLTMRLRMTGLGYDPQHIEAVAAHLVEGRVPDGWRLLPNQTRLALSDSPGQVAADGRRLTLQVAARARFEARVDRNAVRNAVRGLSAQEAIAAAARLGPLAEPPLVGIEASWLAPLWQRLPWLPRRLPWLPARIDVVVLENGQ